MPGMMDTVLNLGLNDDVVAGLAQRSGARFAADAQRRFLDMFACVVLGADHAAFETVLTALKVRPATGSRGVPAWCSKRNRWRVQVEERVSNDAELSAEALQALVGRYKRVYVQHGLSVPEEPREQLRLAIAAVFRSWESERAIVYRRVNRITGLAGTAVNVQACPCPLQDLPRPCCPTAVTVYQPAMRCRAGH